MADNNYYIQGEISGTLTTPLKVTEDNYDRLKNKPTINGVAVQGAKVLSDFGNIVTAQYITLADRKERSGEVSKRDVMYVITDYTTDSDGKPEPGISLGDGNAYIGDLPVIAGIAEQTIQHMANAAIHVSDKDRTSWDDKVKTTISGDTLIFTT